MSLRISPAEMVTAEVLVWVWQLAGWEDGVNVRPRRWCVQIEREFGAEDLFIVRVSDFSTV